MNNTTYTLVKQIYDAINSKKVVTIDILDVEKITPLTEVFIIAVASNVRQTQAMADEVEKILAGSGREPLHKEGYETAKWILLDYGEVIVHILDEEDARFYTLDRLWKDAENIIF